MRSIIRLSTAASALLLAGVAVAAGPVNPPPSSCKITEVYTCEKIGGQTFCSCKPRDLSDRPSRDVEPALKGTPQRVKTDGTTGSSRPGRR